MKVELRPEDKEIVSLKMKTGGFCSAEEVVSAALGLFKLTPTSREEIDRMVQQGIDSGPSTPLTSDDLDGALNRGIERAQKRRG